MHAHTHTRAHAHMHPCMHIYTYTGPILKAEISRWSCGLSVGSSRSFDMKVCLLIVYLYSFASGSVSIMTVWNDLVLQTRFSVTMVAAWAPPMCAMGRTTVEMTQMKGTVQVSTSSITSVAFWMSLTLTPVAFWIVSNPYICSSLDCL